MIRKTIDYQDKYRITKVFVFGLLVYTSTHEITIIETGAR